MQSKMISLVLALAGLACAVFSSPAPAAGELEAIKAVGHLRVGVSIDNPPLAYMDTTGRLNGYEVFLARRLAKDLLGAEDKITFIPLTVASRVETLESDKADIIMTNFTVTPERAETVDFSAPYMKTALAVLSPANAPVANVRQLRGHRLVVTKGSTADLYFSKKHPEVELLRYDQSSQAFSAFLEGRGVALANDSTLIFAWMGRNPGFVCDIASLDGYNDIAPAVKKGNAELLEWINGEFELLRQTNFFQQAYEQTLRPFFGDSVDPRELLP